MRLVSGKHGTSLVTDTEKEYLGDLLTQHPGWPLVLERVNKEMAMARDAFFSSRPGTEGYSHSALTLHAKMGAFSGAFLALYRDADVEVPKQLKSIFEMKV